MDAIRIFAWTFLGLIAGSLGLWFFAIAGLVGKPAEPRRRYAAFSILTYGVCLLTAGLSMTLELRGQRRGVSILGSVSTDGDFAFFLALVSLALAFAALAHSRIGRRMVAASILALFGLVGIWQVAHF